MNNIDFGKLKGFPMTQDVLAYLQQNWTSGIEAMVQESGTPPMIVSGMVPFNGGLEVTPGWCVINGELLAFQGGTVQSHVAVAQTTESLEFADGIAYPVIRNRQAVFTASSTPGAIAFSGFKLFGEVFGARAITAWSNLDITDLFTVLDITNSYVKWRYNKMTRTVEIAGKLTVYNSSGGFHQFFIAQLPQHVFPQHEIYFAGQFNDGRQRQAVDYNVTPVVPITVHHVPGLVYIDGRIRFYLPRDAGQYVCGFNITYTI